jgi:hypothetical protein
VDSYYVRTNGVVRAGAEPVCASDCEGASDANAPAVSESADAGNIEDGTVDSGSDENASVDGGSTSLAGIGALAVSPDGTRVFVGSSQLPSIAVFDLAGRTLVDRGRLTLAEGALGVDRLRLAVDPFKPRYENGDIVGQGDYLANRGRFLYAFARDASVRVIQLEPALANGIGQECDVNIEQNEANKTQLSTAPCIPVGTPGQTRRPLARGPGIIIPVLSSDDREPPLPRDIAFAEIDPLETEWRTRPQGLTGQFGFLMASNGAVYITNLAPKPDEPKLLLANGTEDAPKFDVQFVRSQATHAFREARTQNYGGAKPPSAYTAPLRIQGVTDVLYPTTSDVGPQMDSVTVDQDYSTTGNQETQWATFPDPTSPVSHRWSIVWEDLLPNTSRDSGTVAAATRDTAGAILRAGTLVDAGGDFCSHSVLAGDLVTLPGCLVDADCVPQNKFACRRAPGGVRGICLPTDDAAGKRLVDQCTRFLGSRRRYEIQQATPTQLTLGLKLDEVPRPSTDPCTPRPPADSTPEVREKRVDVCQPTSAHQANPAKRLPAGSAGLGDTDAGFECLAVNGQNRCVKRCPLPGEPAGDSFCRLGHVCENVPGVGPLCVEAPPIDTACWPQPSVSYNVHAGRSFVVTGSALPRVSTTKVVDGQCAPDPSRPADRIPLAAPQCTSLQRGTPPKTSLLIGTAIEPNPCLFKANVIKSNGTELGEHTKAAFQNSQIRFVLANLDEYAGDGLTFRLDVAEGVTPATVLVPSYDIMLSQGVRILVGPTRAPESIFLRSDFSSLAARDPYLTQYPYLFVVDQGRTVITPSARGQILRINPRRSSDGYAAFSPAVTGDAPFQIQ